MKPKTLLMCISFLCTLNLFSQQVITIENTFYSDTALNIFGEIPTFYAFRVKCSTTLNSDSSFVRIILRNSYDYDYIIYEDYALINSEDFSSVEDFGDETYYLPATDGDTVFIQISDAEVFIDKFEYYKDPFEDYIDLQKSHFDSLTLLKVSEMENQIEQNQMLWFAGVNSFSVLPYEIKKGLYGEKYNNEGLDYYDGGLFIKMSQINNANYYSDTLVEDFDWRKKHNANVSTSSYFDNDPDSMYCWWFDSNGSLQEGWVRENGNGWMTGTRDQCRWGLCPNGCYAFATLASIEAVVNLYFNQRLNYDLSEQEAISCGYDILNAGTCWTLPHTGMLGGIAYKIAQLIRDYGISEESCLTWADSMIACTNKCASPNYVLNIDDYTNPHNVITNSQKKTLKEDLINYGPHHVAIGSHSQSLMGWGKVREGQIFIRQYDTIVVKSENPLIGSNYWILKNSGGPLCGDHGYSYFIDNYDVNGYLWGVFRITTPITGLSDTIRCVDLDGDGYYNWGIGPKPANCPSCPSEEDCNDADSLMGPYDGNYYCTCNCGLFTYNSTPLQISQDEIWSDYKYVNRDIVINSGATLAIGNGIGFQKDCSITIEDGGTLLLNDGCILYSVCDTTWKGIFVEGGGTLISNTGSKILLTDSGKIQIDSNGLYIFNRESYILLYNDASCIVNNGEISIGNDATFTFDGEGYLQFDSLGTVSVHDWSFFSLTSSSQNHKVLVINKANLELPEDLKSFRITNGLVYMQNDSAQITVPDTITDIDIENVRFTPLTTTKTHHRGLNLFGQNDCVIDNAIFEYGLSGISGYLTNGTSMSISNCTFDNLTNGIWIHDKSIELSGCTFTHNTNAFYAEYTSSDDNLIDNCIFYNNTYPIQYLNCDGNLFINETVIDTSTQTGICATGNHDLSLNCTNTTNLTGSMKSGVYLLNGAFLNMNNSTSPASTNNYITGYFALRFSNARSFNLDTGYSYICPNSVVSTRHVYGTITTGSCPDNNMLASLNQWYGNLNQLSSSHYRVWKSGCSFNTINSNPTNSYSACGSSKSLIQSNNSLDDDSYQKGVSSIQDADSSGNWHSAFNTFSQIFNGNLPANNNTNETFFEKSWENMRHCLKKMYSLKQLNGTGNSEFAMTIAANNKMRHFQTDNYYRKFQLDLERATLYRMAGDYNNAISILIQLVNDTSLINSEQAESWLCVVNTEKQIKEGTLDKKEAFNMLKECSIWNEAENEKLIKLDNNKSSNSSWISVVPNPSSNESKLFINTSSNESCIVEMRDLFGRLVKALKVQDGYSETQISFSDVSEGIYVISLLKDDKVIANTRITVVK